MRSTDYSPLADATGRPGLEAEASGLFLIPDFSDLRAAVLLTCACADTLITLNTGLPTRWQGRLVSSLASL